MPNWFGKKTPEEIAAEEVERQQSIEMKPPKEITDKLAKIDGLETKFTEFSSKLPVLDRMTSYLDEVDASKRAAKAKELAEKATTTATETEEKWITDPQKAFQESINPLVVSQINLSSRQMRSEIFSDEKEFEYYTGDFKKEVDELIENSLALQARADPASIKNCYFLVLGRRQNEIREGKLKSKFAASSTAAAGTGTTKIDQTDNIVLTDQQKQAAKRFGMTEEQWQKNMKDLSYV